MANLFKLFVYVYVELCHYASALLFVSLINNEIYLIRIALQD